MRASGPRALAVACLLSALGSCAPQEDGHGRDLPDLSVLVQKGHYQALYGPDGKIERLLRDQNGDGRAEVVVVYGADGQPERTEVDSDGDGVVDRREYSRTDGSLEKAR